MEIIAKKNNILSFPHPTSWAICTLQWVLPSLLSAQRRLTAAGWRVSVISYSSVFAYIQHTCFHSTITFVTILFMATYFIYLYLIASPASNIFTLQILYLWKIPWDEQKYLNISTHLECIVKLPSRHNEWLDRWIERWMGGQTDT